MYQFGTTVQVYFKSVIDDILCVQCHISSLGSRLRRSVLYASPVWGWGTVYYYYATAIRIGCSCTMLGVIIIYSWSFNSDTTASVAVQNQKLWQESVWLDQFGGTSHRVGTVTRFLHTHVHAREGGEARELLYHLECVCLYVTSSRAKALAIVPASTAIRV